MLVNIGIIRLLIFFAGSIKYVYSLIVVVVCIVPFENTILCTNPLARPLSLLPEDVTDPPELAFSEIYCSKSPIVTMPRIVSFLQLGEQP